jgi:hypothetical protein
MRVCVLTRNHFLAANLKFEYMRVVRIRTMNQNVQACRQQLLSSSFFAMHMKLLAVAVGALITLTAAASEPRAQSWKAYSTRPGARSAYQVWSVDPATSRDADAGAGPAKRVNVNEWLNAGGRRLLVYGTYAADFNAIEYGQRLRYYWPLLSRKAAVQKCAFLLNCEPTAATKLAELLDLPIDANFELWVDNTGEAGRQFGVNRGWLPDNNDINPFLKLFGMLWGLGAWATLPAVIGGYIGNPFGPPQRWITDALAVGQRQGRWPDTALEMTSDKVIRSKFDDLPWVGSWPRRPLELATLRLQSMLGVSLASWKDLAPNQEALDAGVLTQVRMYLHKCSVGAGIDASHLLEFGFNRQQSLGGASLSTTIPSSMNGEILVFAPWRTSRIF